MRELSETIKEVLAADAAETKDVVIITIPEQQGAITYPETILHLANGDGVFIDGVNYENKLRSMSGIKFSLGKAPDNAEFTIENVSRTLGFSLTDFERSLDGSKVVINRAFKVEGDVWEPDTMFVGYIRDVKVNQEHIEISCNSDMARRGTSVAGDPITQRCLRRFNINGSGIGVDCGWTTSQPGNPLSCDKGLNTENGCQSHGNQHRFGGLPAFTALSEGNGYDPLGTGWGGGTGGGWCIIQGSYILVDKKGTKTWTKVEHLTKETLVVSINDKGQFVPARILKIEKRKVDSFIKATTLKGYSTSGSDSHRIVSNFVNDEGKPLEEFKKDDKVIVYDFIKHIHFQDYIESIEKINKEVEVYMISLEYPNHLYLAGDLVQGCLVSHNRKPTPGDFDFPIFSV